jgi:hypothetical protein
LATEEADSGDFVLRPDERRGVAEKPSGRRHLLPLALRLQ